MRTGAARRAVLRAANHGGVSEEKPLNFVLEWRGEDKERRAPSAREEVAQLSEEAAGVPEVVPAPEPEPVAEPEVVPPPPEPEAEPEPEESPEYFEWTAERERAIQRCLETAPEGTLPTVHVQLSAIHQALKHGNLPAQHALKLLDEIDAYLARHIALEERKVPVAHQEFLNARADKLKAFHAYSEAANALREFVSAGQPVHLDVSAYAADQGTAFLASARQTLFDVEPLEDEEA